MNRMVFDKDEKGNIVVELQEVSRVSKTKAKRGVFSVKGKPVYLEIFFHRSLDPVELKQLYGILMNYKIIDIGDSEAIDREIEKDKAHEAEGHGVGQWSIQCDDFNQAFKCCTEQLYDFCAFDEDITFQLCDEPNEYMRKWLESKDRKCRFAKQVAEQLKMQVAREKYVDVGVGAEIYYAVSRETFNKAVAQLQAEGYSVLNFFLKPNNPKEVRKRLVTKILSNHVISAPEMIQHRGEWYDKRVKIMERKKTFDKTVEKYKREKHG